MRTAAARIALEGVGVRRDRTRRAGLALLAGLASACSSPGAPPEPHGAAPSSGELRIQLLFDEDADLDLYVTDPSSETVYFANTPSRATGGALEADLRCDAPGPRREIVRFERAPPGRYRVGVDHPERCRRGRRAIPYRIIVEDGGRRIEHSGEIQLGEFQPQVLEFER